MSASRALLRRHDMSTGATKGGADTRDPTNEAGPRQVWLGSAISHVQSQPRRRGSGILSRQFLEDSHSGLVRTLGKRVGLIALEGSNPSSSAGCDERGAPDGAPRSSSLPGVSSRASADGPASAAPYRASGLSGASGPCGPGTEAGEANFTDVPRHRAIARSTSYTPSGGAVPEAQPAKRRSPTTQV